MLLDKLRMHKAFDDHEDQMVQDVIEFVSTNEIILGKENPKGHITGSAWIVNKDRSKVLLTHHFKLNMWVQLGGHTEVYETVLESSKREGLEESGLKELRLVQEDIFDVDVHLIPAKGDKEAHYHYDIRYMFEADENEEIVVTDESHDVKWIALEDIERYTTERSVLRMVEKMR